MLTDIDSSKVVTALGDNVCSYLAPVILKRMTLLLFLVLALIFELIHAWEEYRYAFKKGAPRKLTGIAPETKLSRFSQAESNLIVYKVMMVVMFALIVLIVAGGGFRFTGLLILGLYFTYQLHHVIEWVVSRRYNPGLVTALLWVPVVIFWWLNFKSFF